MTFDLESVEGVAVGVARGSLDLTEIKESMATLWSLASGREIRVLWDLRDAQFDLSAGDVLRLAEFAKQRAPFNNLRMAFLLTKDLEFGLVRMFEAFRETKDAQIGVFRDKKHASDWIASSAAQ